MGRALSSFEEPCQRARVEHMAKQTESPASGTFEAAAHGGDMRYGPLPCHRVTFQRG